MDEGRLALVVAVDRYDNPALRQLAAPAADAQALAEALGDPDVGGFRVEVLHNPTSWAAYQQVEGLLADRRSSDLVLVHFSCHGLKDDSGELYLAAANTAPDRLASTAIDAAWINRVMQRSRAQWVVLLLDCCFGGAFERGVIARASGDVDVGDQFRQSQLGEGRGRAVITASTAMEYAFEGAQLTDGGASGPSVFTSALVEGIRDGVADRDQDGRISLGELYDYVYDRVRERSPRQTPCKWEFGLRGGLYIARNPRRRIVPAQLPQEVLDLIDHPTATGRLAAVDELARITAGTNLARAAAARLALSKLVDDDSRRVAASAVEATEVTALRLGATSIDFGRVALGTRPLTAEIGVDGSPLALASAVTTSASMLRARLEAAALRITWTPAEPGVVDEVITLTGATGEYQLRVTGEVARAKDVATSAPPSEPSPATTPLITATEMVDNTTSLAVQTPPANRVAETPDTPKPTQRTADDLEPVSESTVLPTRVVPRPRRGRRRRDIALYVAIVLLFVIGLATYVWKLNRPQSAATQLPAAQPSSARLTGTDSISHVAFSPDGKTLASNDGTVHLWNVAGRRLAGKLDNRDPKYDMVSTVSALAFSPKSHTLVTVSYDAVRLWDAIRRSPLGAPVTGDNEIWDVAFSPDGKTLVSGGSDKTVRLWDVARRRAIGKAMTGHTDTVTTVTFSPNGKIVASGGDRSIRLWDVATRRAIGEPLTGHTDTVRSVAFSPDGKTLASGGDDTTIRLWDVATRRTIGEPLADHSGSVRSVDFSPDGKTLASGSFDDAVRLWDTTRRALGAPLAGHTDDIWEVAFSPDGKTVASCSGDKTIRLWDVAGYGR